MDKYSVDFSEVKYYVEIHEVLKRDLKLPDYYGGNTDALWDCLTDMLGDPTYIELLGVEEVQKRYKSEWDSIVRVFIKIKHAYNDKYSNSFIVVLVNNDGTREELK